MSLETLYVVDTNALIWHLTDDRKLGGQARKVFAAAERGETRLIISAITVAELYYAGKKFGLFAPFSALLARLQTSPHFRLISFRAEDALDFDRDEAVSEMHDRIIVGLARRLSAPLIASDSRIVQAGTAMTIW